MRKPGYQQIEYPVGRIPGIHKQYNEQVGEFNRCASLGIENKSMRIAIVSDTHGNITNFKKIVNWVNKNKIDLILHAGDIGDVSSLKESLQEFKGKLFGVFGNMDKDYKILAKEYNKIKNVEIKENIFEFVFDNVRIAVNHFPNIAKKMAESEKYDLVFYGHTHRPWVEKIGKCFLANPGEAAGQINKPSFAVYDTETKKLELKILEKL